MLSLLHMQRAGEKLGVLVIKASHGGQRPERLLESSGKAQSVHCSAWKDVNNLFALSPSPDKRWWAGSTVGDTADARCHPQSHPWLPAEPAPGKKAALRMLRLNAKRNKKGNMNISHFPVKCKPAAALNLNQLEQGFEQDQRSSRRRAGLRDKPQTGHVQPGLRGSSNAMASPT